MLKTLALDLNGGSAMQLLMSPIFYLCGVLFLGQIVSWIAVLRVTPLSIAYPITSLTVITILLSGVFLFHDPLDLGHIAGSLVIMFGISILTTRQRA